MKGVQSNVVVKMEGRVKGGKDMIGTAAERPMRCSSSSTSAYDMRQPIAKANTHRMRVILKFLADIMPRRRTRRLAMGAARNDAGGSSSVSTSLMRLSEVIIEGGVVVP